MSKYYFCYEQINSGIWSPVLFHDEPPKIKDGYLQSSNGAQCAVTTPVELEYDFEPPSFKMLMHLHPNREVNTVVRPVEGFKTKNGQFFEDEKEATVHEVIYILTGKLIEFTKGTDLENLPTEAKDQLILNGLRFVKENRDEVRRYLDTIPEEPNVGDRSIDTSGA